MPTFGYPPTYYDRTQLPGDEDLPTLDPQPAFLHTKLAATPADAANTHSQNTHIFIPNRQSLAMSTHAYVSYAYDMVLGQRQLDIADEFPDKPPPGFAELRRRDSGLCRGGRGWTTVGRGDATRRRGTRPGEYAVCCPH
jgi:hypothetical protein